MRRNILSRADDLDSDFRLSHCRLTDKRRLKIRVSVVRFRPWAPSCIQAVDPAYLIEIAEFRSAPALYLVLNRADYYGSCDGASGPTNSLISFPVPQAHPSRHHRKSLWSSPFRRKMKERKLLLRPLWPRPLGRANPLHRRRPHRAGH